MVSFRKSWNASIICCKVQHRWRNSWRSKKCLILDSFYASSVVTSPKAEYLLKLVKQGSSYQRKLKPVPDDFIAECIGEEIKRSGRFYLLLNSKEHETVDYKCHTLFNLKYFQSSLLNFESTENEIK